MISRKYSLAHGDSFDLDFSRFLEAKSGEGITEKMEAFVYSSRFLIQDTDNTYRAINHWTTSGLIDDTRESDAKWRKFNLAEIIWITIISHLRQFDMSIKKIKEIKKHIFDTNAPRDDLFMYYIMVAYIGKSEVKLIVFENGEADLVRDSSMGLSKSMMDRTDYLSVSFTSIIDTIFERKYERKDLFQKPLSETEHNLFAQIFHNQEGEYEVRTQGGHIKRFKQKNKKIVPLKNTKDVNLRKLVQETKNAEISIHTNADGKITSIAV
jgi:DNA-binding transcriptional MerR regulator